MPLTSYLTPLTYTSRTPGQAIAEIREQRRLRLRAVSDEAIDDVRWMTRKIVQLRAKGKD